MSEAEAGDGAEAREDGRAEAREDGGTARRGKVRRNIDCIGALGWLDLRFAAIARGRAALRTARAKLRGAGSKRGAAGPKLAGTVRSLPQLPKLPQLPAMASDLRSVRRRAAIVGALLVAGLLGMGWRAWTIAVRGHAEYTAQGNRQQLRTYTLEAGRGNVVDRNHISLAVNDRLERIVLNPRLIRSHGAEERVLEFLLGMFGADRAEYIADELARDKAYRKLKLHLDDDMVAAVRAAKLPGVRLEREPHRVYPRGSLAAHVLGRVNALGQGNLGIELGMNDALAGREASSPAYYAAFGGRGHKLLVDGHPDHAVSRGQTVVSTVDSAIQAMAEAEIDELVRNWHPVGASIIVLDPATGEVLAMTNRPTFDPNHPVAATAQTVNLAVQHAYEPGSTLKAITVAAALEQGTIRADETFFCEEGRWQYTPRHAIRDTKRSGWLDVTEILAVSSNICTTKIYETLGKQALYRWIRRFHFGERPPIELPAVSEGLVADWRKWSDIQAANVSFGQGMSASPLQVAAAFAALANGGLYRAPTLVAEVRNADGELVWSRIRDGAPAEAIVRRATADTVLEMLTAVVETKKGTGKNARIEGYRVAGKTSTAQKANPEGGYFEDQYYASFVGAVPAEDPRLVILVSVDNPEGGHYGNEVAAPAFARLGARVLAYLGVPRHDGTLPSPAPIALRSDDPQLVEGFIADLDVQPDLPGHRAVAFTTGLPDFTGLTLTQALAEAERVEVQLRATGTGLAVGQSVPPGPVDSGAIVHVHFEAL